MFWKLIEYPINVLNSMSSVQGLRDVELSERDSHRFEVRCGYTTFDRVLDEFSASLIKKSVSGTYAAEEAELDGFFGVVWVARCF